MVLGESVFGFEWRGFVVMALGVFEKRATFAGWSCFTSADASGVQRWSAFEVSCIRL